METELKTETTSQTLDDLFRQLGECTYLLTETSNYLDSLKEEYTIILNKIKNHTNGINSKDLGN